MALPTPVADLIQNNGAIGVNRLVFMDFVDNPKRWWFGVGDLTVGGYTWQGTGDLISMDGMEADIGLAANQMSFVLSGVTPELVSLVRNQQTQVKGRRVVVYLQYFDVAAGFAPVGTPIGFKAGIMDLMTYEADGPTGRRITLTAESLFAGRRRPRASRYTDADQQARYPGDLALRDIGKLVNKSARWIY